MLLGIPGDNTFSNYQEANRIFWRSTVIPLLTRAASALADWLSPAYGATALFLTPDLDNVEALASERDALWARLEKTTFLTDKEKRAAVGYGPLANSKFNPNHDDQGRFTFNPDGTQAEAQIVPVAYKPRGPVPPAKPPAAVPPASQAPKVPTATPKGRGYTEHAQERAVERGFDHQKIDAIVDNNARNRVGKVDLQGRKTYEYTDARGNTVVLNESGGIVTTFSSGPGGKYIDKP